MHTVEDNSNQQSNLFDLASCDRGSIGMAQRKSPRPPHAEPKKTHTVAKLNAQCSKGAWLGLTQLQQGATQKKDFDFAITDMVRVWCCGTLTESIPASALASTRVRPHVLVKETLPG